MKINDYIEITNENNLDLMKRYAFNTHGNYDFNEYVDMIKEVLTNIWYWD